MGLDFPNPTRVIAVAAGAEHSVFLSSQGEPFACGYGHRGQLGNGQRGMTVRGFTPVRVPMAGGEALPRTLSWTPPGASSHAGWEGCLASSEGSSPLLWSEIASSANTCAAIARGGGDMRHRTPGES